MLTRKYSVLNTGSYCKYVCIDPNGNPRKHVQRFMKHYTLKYITFHDQKTLDNKIKIR